MSESEVKNVLVAAEGPDQHRYCVVVCVNGDYAISRDGQLINGHRWRSEQLHLCTRMFLQLAGLNGMPFSGDGKR